MHRANLFGAIVTSLALAAPAHAAQSTGYPERPIRLVTGSAAGSGPDIVARVLSERLYKAWSQRIVVDARPGVAGAISADIVARSAADGYTWLMMTSQLFIATKVYKDLKFDLDRDFASIALIGTVPYVLVVNPQVQAKSVPELIQLSKKTELRYGSAGPGGGEHLCMVFFLHMAGMQMLHVPYKGIAQALADAAAREIHLAFAVVPAALRCVQGGRVRPIGVSSTKRAPCCPTSPRSPRACPVSRISAGTASSRRRDARRRAGKGQRRSSQGREGAGIRRTVENTGHRHRRRLARRARRVPAQRGEAHGRHRQVGESWM